MRHNNGRVPWATHHGEGLVERAPREASDPDANGAAGTCTFADNSALSSWSLVDTPNIVLGPPAR